MFLAFLVLIFLPVGMAWAAPQYGIAQPLVTGQSSPVGMVVDSAGTLYWVNWGSGQLLSLSRGATSPTVILSGLNTPQAVGMDGAGNLYYSEYFGGTISMLGPGSSTPSLLLSGRSFPNYLSVDSDGNIFFIEGETCGDKISKYDHASRSVVTLLTFPGPRDTGRGFGGIFMHPSGDLYYTTCGVGTVEKLPMGSSTPHVLLSGLAWTNGIVVDNEENIFFTDYYTSVYMLPAGSSTFSVIATEGSSRNLLAIDSEGSLYYNDNIGGVIWKVPILKTVGIPEFGLSAVLLSSIIAVIFLVSRIAGKKTK
jgi:sugar lactone lactonase YvrE